MFKRIVLVQGHPDPQKARFCRVLADCYVRGAREAGHHVRVIDAAALKFPLLQTKDDFERQPAPPAIQSAQDDVAWSEHVVIIYPMWLGDMPALLKGFMEQLMRPGFAFAPAAAARLPVSLLKGRSAHIVVTMGMPAFFYRWYFGAHGLKNLRRNILAFSGFSPIKQSLIGQVEDNDSTRRREWLAKMERYGRKGI